MTAAARSRFTSALRKLVDDGTFATFVPRHADYADDAHFGPQFLPWHRLYLLELEGALRSVDPSVTLPYCTLRGGGGGMCGAGGARG